MPERKYMTRNIENFESNMLVVERVTPFDEFGNKVEMRSFIARVPLETGVYTTVTGNEMGVTICPQDTQNNRKILLRGADLPKTRSRGKPGQFRYNKSADERIRTVEFPSGRVSSIRQQIGVNEELLFRLEDATDFVVFSEGGT